MNRLTRLTARKRSVPSWSRRRLGSARDRRISVAPSDPRSGLGSSYSPVTVRIRSGYGPGTVQVRSGYGPGVRSARAHTVRHSSRKRAGARTYTADRPARDDDDDGRPGLVNGRQPTGFLRSASAGARETADVCTQIASVERFLPRKGRKRSRDWSSQKPPSRFTLRAYPFAYRAVRAT